MHSAPHTSHITLHYLNTLLLQASPAVPGLWHSRVQQGHGEWQDQGHSDLSGLYHVQPRRVALVKDVQKREIYNGLKLCIFLVYFSNPNALVHQFSRPSIVCDIKTLYS